MAGRLKPPSIEPLSAEAWQRVERAVFAEPERRTAVAAQPAAAASQWQRMLLACVLVLLVCTGLERLGVFQNGRAELASSTPAAADIEEMPEADLGSAMGEGTRIVTTSGPTQTNVGDALLMISDSSVLRVTGNETSGWHVHLHEGKVELLVPKRGQRPDFVVQSQDVRVRVVGTRFAVAQYDAATLVTVSEGTVQVERGENVLAVLHESDAWSSREGVTRVDASPRARAQTATATRSVRASDARARAERRFEQAAALEPTDPDAALALYRRLERSDGTWAPPALFAEARLELQRGRAEIARRQLRRYLRRYPGAANAADARRLLAASADGTPQNVPRAPTP